jgi:hypothetical protein
MMCFVSGCFFPLNVISNCPSTVSLLEAYLSIFRAFRLPETLCFDVLSVFCERAEILL